MTLSDEQISLMAFNDDPGDWNNLAFRDCWVNGYKTGARAIEAEVRKQDDALTPEQISAMSRKHPAEDLCGWSYRLGIADAEAHYGITQKGGS